ncbi:hypothetical protein CPB86DRAFT_255907 [Serendipita vermifera]|nr:hypothetical protein CPB86DRAFT_255907 [Serendipita vermifera]
MHLHDYCFAASTRFIFADRVDPFILLTSSKPRLKKLLLLKGFLIVIILIILYFLEKRQNVLQANHITSHPPLCLASTERQNVIRFVASHRLFIYVDSLNSP